MMTVTTSPPGVDAVEVAPDVYRIDTPLGDRFASLYLVAGTTGTLLYDTGVDGTIPAHVMPALKEMGRTAADVTTVVVSHSDVDHFGGVADARAAFPNARIIAGQADMPLIEDFDRYLAERAREFRDPYGWDEDPAVLSWCREVTREGPLDGSAADGERIDLGRRVVEILAVPGHTPGHIAVDLDWADAVIIGDAVLGASVNRADGTPAFPPTYRHVAPYLATIDKLEARNRQLLLTAHYPTMHGAEVVEFLAESRRFVERLDGHVLDQLRAAPDGLTFEELLVRVNPVAGEWPISGTQGALAFPVAGHLEQYREAGRVRRTGTRNGINVWAAA